jgi:sugar/nucleoside kinase (ribokinase family)
MFRKLGHKKLVLGNFGMFSYAENGKFIWKNPENLIRILPYLDFLFLDKNESFFVSEKGVVQDAADFFRAHGLENLIITDGSKGSHIFVGKEYFKIPAFPPYRLVDTTGAGDTYEAAFIRATELFDDPEMWGRFAAMAATIKLEKRGAFDSSLDEVYKRLGIKNESKQ